jgi:transcriptional regulator with XRE-family HTH domain
MSQEGLALQAEIDRSFMGQVERGQRNVSFVTVCKIASVLKTDLGTLCNGLPVGIDSKPSHLNLFEPLTHQRPEASAN